MKMISISSLLLTLCVLVAVISCFGSNAFAYDSSSLPNHDLTSHGNGDDSTNSLHDMRSYPRSRLVESSPFVYFNVEDYVSESDNGDHTRALMKTWARVCATKNGVFLVRKRNTYFAKQLTFEGPCASNITMQIQGKIEASKKMSDYSSDRRHWILFKDIDGLTVNGGGTFDGNGEIWWKNSCKINKHRQCKRAPTAVTFYGCKNLVVNSLKVSHAQQMHLVIEDSSNVRLARVKISSPGDSPNTDGIHVTSSTNVLIQNSQIAAGDDCISIVSGSSNIRATNIECGPGHGISIGSLGKGKENAKVSNIHVNGATLTGTTNGVRIKSWQGGSGYARDITFENVVMHNVSNPIIIDQNYCDQKKACPKSKSAVQVSQVTYRNIQGTSKSEEAIKFDCSKNSCKRITLVNVHLEKEGGEHKAKADCINAQTRKVGNVFPYCSS